MNQIEERLKEKIQNYDRAYCAGKKYAADHVHDLKDRFLYGEYQREKIEPKQILFWCGSQCTCDGTIKQLADYFYENEKEFHCIWVVKSYKDQPDCLPKDAEVVKKNTSAYWNALAKSKYLVGKGMLPVPFLKREEQIYYYMPEDDGTGYDSVDSRSLKIKEILKADYLLMDSKEGAKGYLKGLSLAADLYQGEVLVKTGQRWDISALAGMITGKAQAADTGKNTMEKMLPVQDKRKKMLFLINWKDHREDQILLRYMLEQMDSALYQAIVAIPRLNNAYLEQEFETLYGQWETFIYRGRLSFREEDFINLKILEKNPEVYVKEPEVRDYVNGLMEKEWKRIWGRVQVDGIVVVGNPTVQQLFLAGAIQAKTRILMDDGFLENYPETKELFQTCDSPAELFFREGQKKSISNSAEVVQMDGCTYFVADSYTNENGREEYRLVQKPEAGSIMINGSFLPDERRKQDLIQKYAEEKKIYLIGAEARNYQSFLPQATVLDSFVNQYLFCYPTAEEFFGKFAAYYGDSRMKRDGISRIISPVPGSTDD